MAADVQEAVVVPWVAEAVQAAVHFQEAVVQEAPLEEAVSEEETEESEEAEHFPAVRDPSTEEVQAVRYIMEVLDFHHPHQDLIADTEEDITVLQDIITEEAEAVPPQ